MIRYGECQYCGEEGFLIETMFGYVHIKCFREALEVLRGLEGYGHA